MLVPWMSTLSLVLKGDRRVKSTDILKIIPELVLPVNYPGRPPDPLPTTWIRYWCSRNHSSWPERL